MGMTGQQIYDNFQNGAGGESLRGLADAMKQLETNFGELGQSVSEAANTIDAGWQGEAGGAASRGAGPLAIGYTEAVPAVGTARELNQAQVNTFNDVKQRVQPVPAVPDKPSGFDNLGESLTLGLADTPVDDYEQGLAEHNAAAQHNVDEMKFYAQSSEHNTSNMPQDFGTTALPDAPNVGITGGRDVAGGGGDFGGTYSGGVAGGATSAASVGGPGGGAVPGGGGPGGGPGGVSGGPGGAIPGGVSGPGAGPGAGGGTGGAGVGGGPGASFGAGPAGYTTSPTGTPGYPATGAPTGGSPGSSPGLFGAAPYGAGGSDDRTRSNRGYGGPAFGATGSGAGGDAGTAAGRGGALGAGGGPTPGAGGRLGVGGVIGDEGVAARGGAGTGAAAGGRGGVPGGMVPPGARGQGDEDAEHESPDYLIEPDPDDAFAGDLPKTAPPVIGD